MKKLSLNTTSQIIQLETNSQSVLSYILKANVDFPNDRTFVLSNFNIYMFSSFGKYLGKLKTGKGPGEISRIVAFTIDTATKLIYAIDNSIWLCIFDYEGNMINKYSIMINKYSIKSFPSGDVSVLDDDNVFLLRNHIVDGEKYFVGIYNISAQKVVKNFVSAEKSPYPKNSISTLCNFIKNKGKLFFFILQIYLVSVYKVGRFPKRICRKNLSPGFYCS